MFWLTIWVTPDFALLSASFRLVRTSFSKSQADVSGQCPGYNVNSIS